MNSVAKVDLVILQGATFRHSLTWQDTAGAPIDMTGYTAKMHIRAAISDADPVEELSTVNGKIVLGGVLGTISLVIPAPNTTAYNWLAGVYDLELTAPSGDVYRVVEGGVTVSLKVTRS